MTETRLEQMFDLVCRGVKTVPTGSESECVCARECLCVSLRLWLAALVGFIIYYLDLCRISLKIWADGSWLCGTLDEAGQKFVASSCIYNSIISN